MTSTEPSLQLLLPEVDARVIELFTRFSVAWPWFGHDWATDNHRAVARAEWAAAFRGVSWRIVNRAFEAAKRQQLWLRRAPTPGEFGRMCRDLQAQALRDAVRMREDVTTEEILRRTGLSRQALERHFERNPLALPESDEAAAERRRLAGAAALAAVRESMPGSALVRRMEARRASISPDSQQR